jgi:hypothetical protein
MVLVPVFLAALFLMVQKLPTESLPASCDWTVVPFGKFLVEEALDAAPIRWSTERAIVTRRWCRDSNHNCKNQHEIIVGTAAGDDQQLAHPCWDQTLHFEVSNQTEYSPVTLKANHSIPHASIQVGLRSTLLGAVGGDWNTISQRTFGNTTSTLFEIRCGDGHVASVAVNVRQGAHAGKITTEKRLLVHRACGDGTWFHVAMNIAS